LHGIVFHMLAMTFHTSWMNRQAYLFSPYDDAVFWYISNWHYYLFQSYTLKHFLARALCLIFLPALLYIIIFYIHLVVLNERLGMRTCSCFIIILFSIYILYSIWLMRFNVCDSFLLSCKPSAVHDIHYEGYAIEEHASTTLLNDMSLIVTTL